MLLSFQRWVCSLLCLLLFITFTPSSDAKQFQIDRLNIADGLPSTTINTLYQQKNGFLWFATDAGVSRYDGQEFIHFQFSPGTSKHISNNFVTDIIEDSQGNIWFATEDGLNQLNVDDELNIYPTAQQPFAQNTNWIMRLYLDSKRQLWIGTGSGLQYKTENGTDFISVPLYLHQQDSPTETSVYSIVEDTQHRLWVGTDYGLAVLQPNATKMLLYQPDKAQAISSKTSSVTTTDLFSDYILVSQIDNQGQIWFGSQHFGLIKFMPNDNTFQHFFNPKQPHPGGIPSNYITSIAIKDEQHIWIGTDNGAANLTVASEHFDWLSSQMFNPQSLPSNNVDDVFIDHSGLVWFATNQGAAYYTPLKQSSRLYKPLASQSELSGANVYAIALTQSGEAWVATDNGIDKINIDNKTVTLGPLKNKQNTTLIHNIWNVKTDKDNNLWFSHAEGVSFYDQRQDTVQHFSNKANNPYGFPNTDFYTVDPDREGNVWITGYLDAGVMLFNPQKGLLKHYFNDSDNLYTSGGNFTFDSLISQRGELWLATTNGIFIVDPKTDMTSHLNLGNERENIRIGGIFEDQQGIIWAATQGLGLAKIIPTPDAPQGFSIEYITRKQGLPDNRLKAVIGDDKGNLWLTSQHMLIKYNPQTREVNVYPSVISTDNLTFNEAAIVYYQNQLLLGSNKGAIQLDINTISQNNFAPPVHITSAKIANQSYININSHNLPPKPVLDYDNNMIQFSFASLDYTAPERNQYRYRLAGFDQDWQSTLQPRAMYTNLAAGDYVFKVQSTNSDGIWSNQQAEFAFNIKKAWWYYALISSGLIILLIIILFALSRIKQMKELSRRANFDSLTGLANRFHFNQQLSLLVSNPYNTAAVVFIDLDHFKEVNDSMGHDVGDELIIQVGKRLQHCLSQQDVLARLGGDEFALIIPYEQTASDVNRDLVNIIERVRQTLNKGYQINQYWLNSSASIGVACFPEDGRDAKTLLKHADTAMYAAKQNGRNGSYFFNETLSTALLERLLIKDQLNNALSDAQFEVHYQPKCCVDSHKIVGLEALLRWKHPQHGMISPVRFIDQAEDSGLIIDIGLWVLEQACQQGYRWHQQGILRGNISVNISPVQLSQPTIVDDIAAILERTAFPAHYLELEITESLLIKDLNAAQDVLLALKQLRVRIALDDFGKGYSSLNYLTQFPIDTLKIDKGFLSRILPEETSNIVLRNIITLGNELKLDVIAEGVETHAQLRKLKQYNCKIVQGFLFSQALDVTQLETCLQHNQLTLREYVGAPNE